MNKLGVLIVISTWMAAARAESPSDSGWPAYGADAGGSRYSSLAQIDTANVSELRVAWVFRTGEMGEG